MSMSQFFPVMIAGFAAAVGFTPITRRLAFYLGVLDQPSSRKVHQKPTPLMGGLAIWFQLGYYKHILTKRKKEST